MKNTKKAVIVSALILLLTIVGCAAFLIVNVIKMNANHTTEETVSEELSNEESEQKEEEKVEDETVDTALGDEIPDETEVSDTETAEENEMEEDALEPEITVSESDLIIIKDPKMYTYEDMQKDLEILVQLYSDQMTIQSLGQTFDGREIYHCVIGQPDAEYKVLITGSIHAREYMTTQLVMKQMAIFLKNMSLNEMYKDQTYAELMENTAVHIVPMINPDGVSISQLGMDGIIHDEVKERVKEIAALDGKSAEGNYLKRWKSNANGVDINRNFDALWEDYAGVGHPSSDHYKGTSVGCEPESAALIALTEKEMFDRTLSYHTQGNVIYWYFAQSGALYDESLDFANCISNITGYPTDANFEKLDPAGYKDWGIMHLGIPGLTVEVGRETSPVPSEQFNDIWDRNKDVWQETILNAKAY